MLLSASGAASVTWRFIDLDLVESVFGAAVFEAIMDARQNDLVDDTILFWRPIKPAVYVGYHQMVEEDIDVKTCRELGVPIVRRILGGGAGYCDANQIIYNIIFKEGAGLPHGPKNVYRLVLRGVMEALRILGISDVSVDENRFSVYANGKKISGSGQLSSQGVVNSSGSFLVDFDYVAMCAVLKDPVKNLKQGVRKPEDGLTFLRKEIPGATMDSAKEALRSGFERVLGEVGTGALTDYELGLAEKLRPKYLSAEWIFRSDLRRKRRDLSAQN
jgi:lipoate-protein ligase A